MCGSVQHYKIWVTDSEAGERQSGKSVNSSVSGESSQPPAELAVAAAAVVGPITPVVTAVSLPDKQLSKKSSRIDQEVLTSLAVIGDALEAVKQLPEMMAKRDEAARTELAEQLAGWLTPPEASEPAWQVYPVPERLTAIVEKHRKSGHSEAGTHRDRTLAGGDYRTYLWSLTARELAIEQAATAWSSLAKGRQIEHDMHFLEDRVRKFAALPAEIQRTHQQATSALQAAEESANLAEQNTARAEWARERSDWLNVQLRGTCIGGLWALCWAGRHFKPRSR